MRRALSLSLLIVLLLSGCMLTPKISDNVFVQAIAVDFQDDKYIVYCSLLNPDSAEAVDSSQNLTMVIQTEGDSVTDALYQARKDFPKRLNLSRNRVLILSETVLREKLSDVICFYGRNYETRLSVRVYGYRGDIAEVMSVGMHNAVNPAADLFKMAEYGEKAGLFTTPTGLDISVALYDETSAFLVPILQLHKEKSDDESDENNDSLELAGAALFTNGDYTGELTREISIPVSQLILGAHGSDVQVIDTPDGGRAAVQTLSRNNKLRATVANGKATLQADITAEGYLLEIYGSNMTLDEQGVAQLNQAYAVRLQEEITLALQSVCVEQGSDVFGMGRRIAQREPQLWRSIEANWRDLLSNAQLNVTVQAEITKIGQLYQS